MIAQAKELMVTLERWRESLKEVRDLDIKGLLPNLEALGEEDVRLALRGPGSGIRGGFSPGDDRPSEALTKRRDHDWGVPMVSELSVDALDAEQIVIENRRLGRTDRQQRAGQCQPN